MSKPLLLIFLFLATAACNAQNEDSAFKSKEYGITMLPDRFDHLVDSCTALLLTKNFARLPDSANIYIIMCNNTVFYTIRKDRHFRQRFEGGRYELFRNAFYADTAAYLKALSRSYLWKVTSGLGMYFPKLGIECGGMLHRHSMIKVLDRSAQP
jgi:hypothetical protein